MALKIGSKFITANGKRVGVRYFTGPWMPNVNPTLIKIRPRNGLSFPQELRAYFEVENNSDSQQDYFEKDTIRICSAHPLYEQIAAAAQ